MVGNAKLVVTNFMFQPRPKTPNPFRKSLLPASPRTFCWKLFWQTFFVLQCSQRSLFQICNCVIIREVTVGNAKLVVTNFRYQPQPKTPNPCWELLLPVHLEVSVHSAFSKHSLLGVRDALTNCKQNGLWSIKLRSLIWICVGSLVFRCCQHQR